MQHSHQQTTIQRLSPVCAHCDLSPLCCIANHDGTGRRIVYSIQKRAIKKNQLVYRESELSRFIYAVRSGSLKAVANNCQAEELVEAFYFSGDSLGLESLASEQHDHTLVSLEPVEYCAIPVGTIRETASRSAAAQAHLIRLLSKQVKSERLRTRLRSGSSSRNRVAAYLLDLQQRQSRSRQGAISLRLTMSRHDIAAYLGLTVETVSRCFSNLQRDGLLRVRAKRVELLHIDQLYRLCGFRPAWPALV